MNYSKWDNLEVSSDEEDEKPKARITKLDNPSSITFGGGMTGMTGSSPIEVNTQNVVQNQHSLPTPPVVKSNKVSTSVKKKHIKSTETKHSLSASYSKWDTLEISDDEENDYDYDEDDDSYIDDDENAMEVDESEAEEQARLAQEVGLPTQAPPSMPGPKAKNEKVLDLYDENISRNGSFQILNQYGYVWGQNRKEVFLYYVLPNDIKGKNIQIEAKKWNLKIQIKNNHTISTLLDGRLAYPIGIAGDTKGDAASEGDGQLIDVDWEIKDAINSNPSSSEGMIRVLCLTLTKKAPSPEITVWWQNVINGHKGFNVSVEEMPDRATASQSLFQKNWNEAHIKFKEKVSKIEKVNVSLETEEVSSSTRTSAEIEEDDSNGKEKVIEYSHTEQGFDLDA